MLVMRELTLGGVQRSLLDLTLYLKTIDIRTRVTVLEGDLAQHLEAFANTFKDKKVM